MAEAEATIRGWVHRETPAKTWDRFWCTVVGNDICFATSEGGEPVEKMSLFRCDLSLLKKKREAHPEAFRVNLGAPEEGGPRTKFVLAIESGDHAQPVSDWMSVLAAAAVHLDALSTHMRPRKVGWLLYEHPKTRELLRRYFLLRGAFLESYLDDSQDTLWAKIDVTECEVRRATNLRQGKDALIVLRICGGTKFVFVGETKSETDDWLESLSAEAIAKFMASQRASMAPAEGAPDAARVAAAAADNAAKGIIDEAIIIADKCFDARLKGDDEAAVQFFAEDGELTTPKFDHPKGRAEILKFFKQNTVPSITPKYNPWVVLVPGKQITRTGIFFKLVFPFPITQTLWIEDGLIKKCETKSRLSFA